MAEYSCAEVRASGSQNRNFEGTAKRTLATLKAVGMQEAFFGVLAFEGLELHGANGVTELATGGASVAHEHPAVILGQTAAAGRRPGRQRPHRAEGAP